MVDKHSNGIRSPNVVSRSKHLCVDVIRGLYIIIIIGIIKKSSKNNVYVIFNAQSWIFFSNKTEKKTWKRSENEMHMVGLLSQQSGWGCVSLVGVKIILVSWLVRSGKKREEKNMPAEEHHTTQRNFFIFFCFYCCCFEEKWRNAANFWTRLD